LAIIIIDKRIGKSKTRHNATLGFSGSALVYGGHLGASRFFPPPIFSGDLLKFKEEVTSNVSVATQVQCLDWSFLI
jgi:hypothetical protein